MKKTLIAMALAITAFGSIAGENYVVKGDIVHIATVTGDGRIIGPNVSYFSGTPGLSAGNSSFVTNDKAITITGYPVNGSCTITMVKPDSGPSVGISHTCKGLEYREIFSNGDGTQTILTFNDKNEITGSKVVPEEPNQRTETWTIQQTPNIAPKSDQKYKFVF